MPSWGPTLMDSSKHMSKRLPFGAITVDIRLQFNESWGTHSVHQDLIKMLTKFNSVSSLLSEFGDCQWWGKRICGSLCILLYNWNCVQWVYHYCMKYYTANNNDRNNNEESSKWSKLKAGSKEDKLLEVQK